MAVSRTRARPLLVRISSARCGNACCTGKPQSRGRKSDSASISLLFKVSIRCRSTVRLVVSAKGCCSFGYLAWASEVSEQQSRRES
jgi:hypothetical protein